MLKRLFSNNLKNNDDKKIEVNQSETHEQQLTVTQFIKESRRSNLKKLILKESILEPIDLGAILRFCCNKDCKLETIDLSLHSEVCTEAHVSSLTRGLKVLHDRRGESMTIKKIIFPEQAKAVVNDD